jgi:hypothetical protein
MKYIPAEKLLSEIKKIRQAMIDKGAQKDLYDAELIRRSTISTCDDLLKLITSLQQEQPEEMDENFFFDEVLKVYDDNNKYPPRSEEELIMLEIIARHFYELGLNARKED